jgi:hypothetical protein
MISKPTTQQLINAVCTELDTKVAPAVTDATAKLVLDMAMAVLKGVGVRSANELAWMREEADAIESVARRLVAELPENIDLREALQSYLDIKSDSRYLARAEEEYERAGEVLSRAVEAAYADGDADRKAAVRALIDQRMANEFAVVGQYVGVGRG